MHFHFTILTNVTYNPKIKRLFEVITHFLSILSMCYNHWWVVFFQQGLYYSYFKTLVSASTAMEGLHAIMYDNITEFPSTINTLKRFNLYPEVRFLKKHNFLLKCRSECNFGKFKNTWQFDLDDISGQTHGMHPQRAVIGHLKSSRAVWYWFPNWVFIMYMYSKTLSSVDPWPGDISAQIGFNSKPPLIDRHLLLKM